MARWLHLIWFGMSLAVGTLLAASAHGTERITSGAIYATSVSAMFGVSALYHRGTWTDAWRRRMQRLDHVMIFFLIAGTATPVLLLAIPGAFGLAWLIVVSVLAVAAAAIHHLRWMSAPELLVGATFVGLGWAAGLALGGRVGPRGRGASSPGAGWRAAVYRWRGVLSPPPSRPLPVGVRLSRGFPCLRLRRCSLPVRCDRPASPITGLAGPLAAESRETGPATHGPQRAHLPDHGHLPAQRRERARRHPT